MSKPPFSRKRKGKSVDPYPLRDKGPSKSSSTKRSGKGRPKKPVEANILVANQIGRAAGIIDQYMVDEKGYQTDAVDQLRAIEKEARKGMTKEEAKAAVGLISQIREAMHWDANEGGMVSGDVYDSIKDALDGARDGLLKMDHLPSPPQKSRVKSTKALGQLKSLVEIYDDDIGFTTDADLKLKAILSSMKDGVTQSEAKIHARTIDQIQENFYWVALEGGAVAHDKAEDINDLLLETSNELERLAKG